jgi:hypothetical protein
LVQADAEETVARDRESQVEYLLNAIIDINH